MEQDIAQLLCNIARIAREDGFAQLISLFNSERSYGFERLFPIPGTFGAQLIHNVEQRSNACSLLSVLIIHYFRDGCKFTKSFSNRICFHTFAFRIK